ncbi:MAG: acyl carrier protein [Burkholderiales bacterium]
MATREQVRAALLEALGAIAPEADLDAIAPDKPLREQLDIDSYDFLNLVIRLHEALGIEVPEADYGQLATLNGAIDYFASRSEAK